MHSFTLIRIRTTVLVVAGFLMVSGKTVFGDSFWLAPIWQAALIALMTFTALTSETVTVVWLSLGIGLSMDALTIHPMGICAVSCLGSSLALRRFRPYISNDQITTQILTAYFLSFSMHVLTFLSLQLVVENPPVWRSYSGSMYLWTAIHLIWLTPLLFKTAAGWDLKMWKKWRQVSAFRDNQQIKQRASSNRFGGA